MAGDLTQSMEPAQPETLGMELSDEQLGQVAGGGAIAGVVIAATQDDARFGQTVTFTYTVRNTSE